MMESGEGMVNKCTLWHLSLLRLGHVPMDKLKCITEINKTVHDNVCLTCPMSKMFKLPFYLRHTKTHHLFELVHMVIWGPYKVPTHKGYRYFMTLVDDKSRATWVHLMQRKSQVFSILKTFHNYIAN